MKIDTKRVESLPILPATLEGKAENLVNDLIDWMREKELSVLQANSLLTLTKTVIEEAWREEETRVKV